MNTRPDGEGLDLRIRELEVIAPFGDLAISLAAAALAAAEQSESSSELGEKWRLVGRSEGLTEAAGEITKLFRSHHT